MNRLVSLPRQTAAALAAGAALAVSLRRAGGRPVAARRPQGQRRSDLPGLRRLVSRIPTAATTCCSATTTATRSRRSTSRWGRTTGSSRAAPIWASPRYFQPRRGWGVFAIKVPKDFGSEKRYTWTIVANGKTASVPVGPHQGLPDRAVQGHRRGQHAAGAEVLADRQDLHRAADRDRAHADRHGRPAGDARGRSSPTTCTRKRARTRRSPAASPRLVQSWHKHRGPGDVKFSEQRPKIGDDGKTTTTATFSAARRVHAARAGQRQLGRGRRRLPVLLDQRLREGDDQVASTGLSATGISCSSQPVGIAPTGFLFFDPVAVVQRDGLSLDCRCA